MIDSNDKLNRSRPGRPSRANPARHARKCVICKHPERKAIDEAFIHWSHVDTIVEEHQLPSRTNLYRHALATGLFGLRRRKMRNSLEFLIAEAQVAKVTGDCVIRAIRAHSRVTSDGRWIEPPKEIIIWRRAAPSSSPSVPGPAAEKREALKPNGASEPVARDLDNTADTPIASGLNAPTAKRENSNRNQELLEIGVTSTKQKPEAKSNRSESGHIGEHV
jgi:hypothetical protein